jgi:hypothetical protein
MVLTSRGMVLRPPRTSRGMALPEAEDEDEGGEGGATPMYSHVQLMQCCQWPLL